MHSWLLRAEPLFDRIALGNLRQAASEITSWYAPANRATPPLARSWTLYHRLAYLAARAPATSAAVDWVLAHLPEDAAPASLLDWGTGPGTALAVALDRHSSIATAEAVEADPQWLALAQRLADPDRSISWRQGDSERALSAGPFDLVIAAYSLGEMSPQGGANLIAALWDRCSAYLVLVEPGTPAGFHVVLQARAALLARGACLIAPCPLGPNEARQYDCPMAALGADGGPWCHVPVRVERSRRHRLIKGADMGWEDEKISYLVAARPPTASHTARIVGPVDKTKAAISFPVCTEGELRTVAIPSREKETTRRATSGRWGDAWEGWRPATGRG